MNNDKQQKNNVNVQNNNEPGCLTVFLKLWFRTSIVSIILYLLSQFFNSLDGNDFILNRESKVGQPTFNTTQTLVEEPTNEVVLTALNNNHTLTEEEKSLISSLENIISENPYLDTEKAEQQLSEIRIRYTNKDNQYSDNTVGVYDYNTNTINMFSDKDKTAKANLAHEVVHGIFHNEKTANIPEFIREGVTQELVDEYLSNVPSYEESTYPFEVTVVKMLCEMTDKDTVLKAYTTGDMRELKMKLSGVMGANETEKFITNIENIFKTYHEGKEVSLEQLASVIKYADSYFVENDSNIEKLEAYSYYRGIIQQLGTKEPSVGLNMYLSEKGIYVKPYFSEKLKEKFNGPYYSDYKTASQIRNEHEAKEYIRY